MKISKFVPHTKVLNITQLDCPSEGLIQWDAYSMFIQSGSPYEN